MQEIYGRLLPKRTLPRRIATWLLSMLFFTLLFFTLQVALTGIPSALANTINVTNTNNSGAGSLRQALINAQANDTIVFTLPPTSTIKVSSELAVTKPITVDGSAAINLQVSGNRSTRVFNISESVTLRGFMVVQGAAAGDGGGVSSDLPLTLIDMRFENNTASGSGGGVYAAATLTMMNTRFYSNTASSSGGAVRVINAATIQNSEFSSNKASIGAGLSANDRTGITNTFFLYNGSDTTTNGGGFYHDFGGVAVTIANSLFARNFAQTGAALSFTDNATATLSHLTIVRSFGAGSAVAVSNGTVEIRNSIVASNTTGLALTGGSLFSDYNLFAGNTTNKSGAVSGGSNEVSGDPAFVNPAMGDYRLRMTSAARDKGTNAGIASDFEGQARSFGTAPDIGFDEVPIETNSRCYATRDDLIVFGSADGKALQWAVSSAFYNDTIKVAGACVGMPGSVMADFGGVSMGMRGGYTVTNWTISNHLVNPTILDALGNGPVLYTIGTSPRRTQLTIENLTIQNGKHSNGGGGISAQDLVLTNVNVLSSTALLSSTNSSTAGGGVYAATAIIQGGLFYNNYGDSGGGLYTWESLILTGTQFISNTASQVHGGGGILARGPAQITNAFFGQNTSLVGSGGGLAAEGSLILNGSTFQDNSAPLGAGVYAEFSAQVSGGRFENNANRGLYVIGDLTLSGTQFLNNPNGGAAVFGTAQVSNALFQDNSKGGLSVAKQLTLTNSSFITNSGGGLDAGGGALITDSLFRNNSDVIGGGVYVAKLLQLGNTKFISNTGGGVYARDAVQVSNSLFQSNILTTSSEGGGGLYVGITLTMTATQFISNVASFVGGGAYVEGPAQVTGGLFRSNRAGSGGGLRVNKTLWLSGTHFIANTGGGAFISDAAQIQNALFQNNREDGGLTAFGTLLMTGTQFIGNSNDGNGGGAFVNAETQISGTLFQNNQCTSEACKGGGLYAGRAVTVTNTRFLGNLATDKGGGLYQFGGIARVVNSLFARNGANSGEGAAVYLNNHTGAQILHTTITSPTLVNGSAIFGAFNNTLGITNTIITSHTTGLLRNNGGTFFENYNLFFGNTKNTFTPFGSINGGSNDLTGNPAFVNPAADDYHLTANSAALDRATNVGVTLDFEGQPRPQGLGSDIGYDESPFAATLSGLSASNNSPTALGRATNFTATATGNNLRYTWNFGDGTPTITGASTVHTYTLIGNYTAVVTVTNGISTLVASTAVSITDASIRNLVASNNSPTVLGSVTTLSATATGSGIVYTWNFGDGTAKATGATIPHTYPAVGNYTAIVTATNSISTVVANTPVSIVSVPTPKISVALAREGSGAVLPGTVVTYQVAITNTGGVAVRITNIQGGVPTVEQILDSAGVTLVDAACATPINLAPAAVHRCSLTWVAAGTGGQQVNFVVTVNSSADNGQTSSVSTQSPVLIANPTPTGEPRIYLPVVLK